MLIKEWIVEVVASVHARICSYFVDEFAIQIGEIEQPPAEHETLDICGLTAVIGVGGPAGILIAFSYEQRLIDELYERMTDGMDVQPDEKKMYMESVAGDIINTIVGNCTADLQHGRHAISLTPPMIIDHIKHIHRTKNVVFISKKYTTEYGCIDLNLIGPGDMFDKNLDYVK